MIQKERVFLHQVRRGGLDYLSKTLAERAGLPQLHQDSPSLFRLHACPGVNVGVEVETDPQLGKPQVISIVLSGMGLIYKLEKDHVLRDAPYMSEWKAVCAQHQTTGHHTLESMTFNIKPGATGEEPKVTVDISSPDIEGGDVSHYEGDNKKLIVDAGHVIQRMRRSELEFHLNDDTKLDTAEGAVEHIYDDPRAKIDGYILLAEHNPADARRYLESARNVALTEVADDIQGQARLLVKITERMAEHDLVSLASRTAHKINNRLIMAKAEADLTILSSRLKTLSLDGDKKKWGKMLKKFDDRLREMFFDDYYVAYARVAMNSTILRFRDLALIGEPYAREYQQDVSEALRGALMAYETVLFNIHDGDKDKVRAALAEFGELVKQKDPYVYNLVAESFQQFIAPEPVDEKNTAHKVLMEIIQRAQTGNLPFIDPDHPPTAADLQKTEFLDRMSDYITLQTPLNMDQLMAQCKMILFLSSAKPNRWAQFDDKWNQWKNEYGNSMWAMATIAEAMTHIQGGMSDEAKKLAYYLLEHSFRQGITHPEDDEQASTLFSTVSALTGSPLSF